MTQDREFSASEYIARRMSAEQRLGDAGVYAPEFEHDA